MNVQNSPKMPRAQTRYGSIVYWVTILSCIICTIGPVISVASPDNNVLNPYKLFNAIFEGKDARTVWQEVGGEFPGGHFYLKRLTYGDGFTQFGLALGCSVALWALLASAVAYASDKNYLYLSLSIWVAIMVALSMVGIFAAH
ncbi:hypothetical protein JY97_05265 [Alkalispirochaeta odontotermitis]|nr:hypothetical protein JY97_05265 [Alkalispirochaeta odontotermitis]CAB1083774.1 hypothetical protein D1AOALGA4SA_11310 [Olavius algarvensis Delta 1 endosymbiont]